MQSSGAVGGWVELGRTTLGGTNVNVDVSSLSDKRYYMILSSITGTSSNSDVVSYLNNDTGTNYSRRGSINGAADYTNTSIAGLGWRPTSSSSTTPSFEVGYIANRSTNEKLMINHTIRQLTAGASTAPERSENISKHAQTTNPVDQFTLDASGAITFNSGSEVVVLGWDPDDTHTNNFWEELVSTSGSTTSSVDTGTFTAKKYLWIQSWVKLTSGSAAVAWRLGNSSVDSGSNYARRYSINGGEGTSTSSNHMDFGTATLGTGESQFMNCFMVNNASNEKLIIGNGVDNSDGTGAATANARKEFAMKWSNTSNQANIFGLDDLGSGATWSYEIKIWGAD